MHTVSLSGEGAQRAGEEITKSFLFEKKYLDRGAIITFY